MYYNSLCVILFVIIVDDRPNFASEHLLIVIKLRTKISNVVLHFIFLESKLNPLWAFFLCISWKNVFVQGSQSVACWMPSSVLEDGEAPEWFPWVVMVLPWNFINFVRICCWFSGEVYLKYILSSQVVIDII